jgi:hypothetical protein
MRDFDLIILPTGFADPTTALRPYAISIVFGVKGERVARAEYYIRRHISVNATG